MKRLKILLVGGGRPNGVSYHRLLKPHQVMCRHYEVDVNDCDAIEQVSDESLQKFDIVIANRTLANGATCQEQLSQIKRIKHNGCKFIIDIDDYWYLHHGHELSKWWVSRNMTSLIEANISNADYVMTTHDVIGKLTKRDYIVMPNGIDASDMQWNVKPKAIRNTVEFGWCGSNNHIYDINLMGKALRRLNGEDVNYRMAYVGYSPKMPNVKKYEHVLTGYDTAKDNQYVNIQGLPVDEYATLYDQIDVALIPMVNNQFNSCKSNLKMLEAGFKKKAVIVSDVHPYTPLINHGVNCLKVNSTDNNNGWYKSIKRLCNDRELIKQLADQLHKDVQAYELSNLCHDRYKFYQSIIK